MQVNLYTTTFNNEATINQFVTFYKERVPDIIIRIHDLGSTDKTKDKAKELGCIVSDFKSFFTSKEEWRNNCWKHIPTDSVVLANIDEYIDITPDLFFNCSLIQSKGYDITDISNLEIKEENRNIQYDKFCIFDKSLIKEMNFENGVCNPIGFILIGEKKPIMYHLIKPVQ